MEALSQTAMAVTGLNGGVAAQLAGQRSTSASGTRCGLDGMPRPKILLGPEHANYVLKARDDARSHIVLGSHRMGRSANNLSIRPTRAAVDQHGVEAVIYLRMPS